MLNLPKNRCMSEFNPAFAHLCHDHNLPIKVPATEHILYKYESRHPFSTSRCRLALHQSR